MAIPASGSTSVQWVCVPRLGVMVTRSGRESSWVGAGSLSPSDRPCRPLRHECTSLGCRQEPHPPSQARRHVGAGCPAHRGVHTLATWLPPPGPRGRLPVARCWGRWWGHIQAGGRQAAAGRGASSFREKSRWSGGGGGGAEASDNPRSGGKLRPGAVGWSQSGPDSTRIACGVQFCMIVKITTVN